MEGISRVVKAALMAGGLAVVLLGTSGAQQVLRVERPSGDTVFAAVLDCADAECTVEDGSGEIFQVPRDQIQWPAETGSSDVAPADGGALRQQINQVHNELLGDPATMEKIMKLQNDPDVQRVLEDPEVMRAVAEGNIAALLSNPDFVKLMENPTIQEIQEMHGDSSPPGHQGTTGR